MSASVKRGEIFGVCESDVEEGPLSQILPMINIKGTKIYDHFFSQC